MGAPWTAFYWKDYLSKTRHLSLVEHGAYWQLLAHYYCTGGPLPCFKHCLRIASAFLPEEQQAVERVLEEFFEQEGEGYRHSRCDEEISKASSISSGYAKRAKAGAEARWKKQSNSDASSNASSNAKPMLNDAQPQPQPHKDQKLLSNPDSTGELPLSDLRRKGDEKIPIQRVFAYYVEKLEKSAAYTLTDKRLKQGLARFKEASVIAPKLKPSLPVDQIPEAAEKLMKYAIDRLLESDYHMGRDRNSNGQTYNDWDNLFRSAEQFQKWLEKLQGARATA